MNRDGVCASGVVVVMVVVVVAVVMVVVVVVGGTGGVGFFRHPCPHNKHVVRDSQHLANMEEWKSEMTASVEGSVLPWKGTGQTVSMSRGADCGRT